MGHALESSYYDTGTYKETAHEVSKYTSLACGRPLLLSCEAQRYALVIIQDPIHTL